MSCLVRVFGLSGGDRGLGRFFLCEIARAGPRVFYFPPTLFFSLLMEDGLPIACSMSPQ